MPVLEHTTPCSVCPFRRGAAPGYMGEATPEDFVAAALAGAAMPCHALVDYEDPDWEENQLPDTPLCAGSLVFLRNTCTIPRDPILAEARTAVRGDHAMVFSNRQQFLDHHARRGA